MSDFKYAKVGDRLYSLVHGYVQVVEVKSYPQELICRRGDGLLDEWQFDGRHFPTDENPDLYWDRPKIISPEKPKRKVKKTIEGWLNVYPEHGYDLHSSKEQADKYAGVKRIGCYKFIGSYEAEE